MDQLQMAPLVPDDSLMRLFTSQGKYRHLALCLHLIQTYLITIIVLYIFTNLRYTTFTYLYYNKRME